jgi:hypothetical protein
VLTVCGCAQEELIFKAVPGSYGVEVKARSSFPTYLNS